MLSYTTAGLLGQVRAFGVAEVLFLSVDSSITANDGNCKMKNNKLFDPIWTVQRLVVSIATVCATFSAYADAYTFGGVTWNYTVTSGTSVTLTGVSDKTVPFDAANIPWTFTNNDTTYTVTAIENNAFGEWTTLTGTLMIPEVVTRVGEWSFAATGIQRIASLGGGVVGYRAFSGCSSLTGVVKANKLISVIGGNAFRSTNLSAFYAPGPDTGTAMISGNSTFRASGLQVAFIGWNVVPADGYDRMLGCKVFVPANGKWDDFIPGSGDNGPSEAIYYGANTNLNLIVDDDAGKITAIPTDGTAFATMLEVAPTLKTYLGWDMHITVTNMLEVAAGVITSENVQWVNSFNSIVFKVDTQSYLDTLLNAIPPTVLLAIDPCDAREVLTIPQGREVFVRLSGDGRNGRYSPKIKGLTVVCR